MVVDQELGQPEVDLTITQNATAMTVEYRSGGNLTCKLDGAASKNMVAGRAGGAPDRASLQVARAGNTLVVTTTTATGDEKRTFTTDGAYLVVDTSAPARGAPNITKVTCQR